MEKKQLQVGDVIYKYNYGNITYRGKIERVTEKRAYSGYLTFKREYSGGSLMVIGGGKWDSSSYCIESLEDIEKFNRQIAIREMKNTIGLLNANIHNIGTDFMKRITEDIKNELSKIKS